MNWDMRVGDVEARTAIQKRHGGSESRGISAPARGSGSTNIILWWRPERGELFGYSDGWAEGGEVFYYSGTGQAGDQRFEAPNAENGRVRDHSVTGDDIRLVRYVAKNSVQYMGQLRLDPADPWRWRDGPDRYGRIQKIIQFHFLPVGEVLRRPGDPVQEVGGNLPTPTSLPEPLSSPTSTELEALKSNAVQRALRAGVIMTARDELILVHRFRDWLLEQGGVNVTGLRIPYAPESRSLRADMFIQTSNTLIEAKSSAARDHIRQAIGQLLDYQRFLTPSPRLCVLTPTRPADDMLSLLSTLGIEAAYPDGPGSFSLTDPALAAGTATPCNLAL